MTKRGIGEMWWIISVGVIALFVMAWALGFMTPVYRAGSTAIDTAQLRVNFLKCPPADDPKQDIDMDGCIDTQDFCVVDWPYLISIGYKDKIPDVITEEDLCALGNQNCDYDKDFVPDICDPSPKNANVACDIVVGSWLEGKCPRIPKDVMDELPTFAMLPNYEAAVQKDLIT